MKKLALVALALALGLAVLVAAGCGGKVPQGAIATVGGVPVTQAQFDQYINQAKASAQQTGQAAFPSVGTTAYNRYAAEIVNYLVEQQLVLNGADKMKVTVTDKDVQTQLTQIAAQYGGTQKMYAAAKKAGMDPAQLTTYVKNSLLRPEALPAGDRQVHAHRGADAGLLQGKQGAVRPGRHAYRAPRPGQDQGRGDQGAGAARRQQHHAPTGRRSPRSTRSTPAPRTAAAASAPSRSGRWSSRSTTPPSRSRSTRSRRRSRRSTAGTSSRSRRSPRPRSRPTPAPRRSIQSTLTSQQQTKTWQAWLAKQKTAAKIKYAAGYNPDQLTAAPSASPSPSSSK